jgi:hypothetical protein
MPQIAALERILSSAELEPAGSRPFLDLSFLFPLLVYKLPLQLFLGFFIP